MPVASRPAQAKRTTQLPAPGETGWLVAVALAFLLVHIVAGTICLRASANEAAPSRDEAASRLYD
jgi:hypothetical protein